MKGTTEMNISKKQLDEIDDHAASIYSDGGDFYEIVRFMLIHLGITVDGNVQRPLGFGYTLEVGEPPYPSVTI